MALEKNLFFKVTSVVHGTVTEFTTKTSSVLALYPFNYRVETEDFDKVVVYCNGQAIPDRANVTAVSKYYYEISNALAPGTVNLGSGTVPADTSTVTFAIKTNQAWVGPAYAPVGSSTGGQASFSDSVMTLTTQPSGGAIAIGQHVTGVNIPAYTYINALKTGTINAVGSTYDLTTTPGTIDPEAITTSADSILGSSFTASDSFIITYFYTVYTVV
ncbi:MAG: hypothetical protein JHC33_10185 [Ignisphaera sp.]|nr:hypothetical protein [Ignisphaera sp.]